MSRRKKKGASDPQARGGGAEGEATPLETSAEAAVEVVATESQLDHESIEPTGEDSAAVNGEDVGPSEASLDGEPALAADDAPDGAALDGAVLEKILEAVLFSAAAPVPVAKLARAFENTTKEEIVDALGRLAESLTSAGRGIRLLETGSGWQLLTAVECASYVRRFFAEKPPRLSRALLETLAIVAYRQPATRGEVEAVRGVDCDAILTALLTRGLVQVVGRRHAPGRPVEFGTTAEFLELFSMRDLEELPPLPDADSLAALVAEVAGNVDLGPDGDGDGDADANLADASETSEGDEPEEGSEIDGATAEDPESGGGSLEASGGGSDPGGSGPGEREGGVDAGDEGGSGSGPDHG